MFFMLGIEYFDFKKAFNKVLHEKLIIKMRTVGVISEWVWNWLRDRADMYT